MNLHLDHIQSLLFFSSVELDLFYRLKDTGLVLNDVKNLTVKDYDSIKLPKVIKSIILQVLKNSNQKNSVRFSFKIVKIIFWHNKNSSFLKIIPKNGRKIEFLKDVLTII